MADPNLLAQIIAGQDPLAAQMLQGYQGAQLSQAALNPEFGHNEGPFGALAKTIAGFAGNPMMNHAVQDTTQARIAAQPELARLLASPDPYQTLAQNPGAFSPLARAPLVNASPEQVAQTREATARAALLGAQTNLVNTAATPPPPLYGPGGPQGAPRGAVPGVVPSLPGNGRYPQPAASAEPAGADPVAQAMALPPQQRAAMMQNPQMRAQLLAKLRAMAAQRAQPPIQAGGGNAARPPT